MEVILLFEERLTAALKTGEFSEANVDDKGKKTFKYNDKNLEQHIISRGGNDKYS